MWSTIQKKVNLSSSSATGSGYFASSDERERELNENKNEITDSTNQKMAGSTNSVEIKGSTFDGRKTTTTKGEEEETNENSKGQEDNQTKNCNHNEKEKINNSIFGHPPHLFDEISISTKDSFGGTTIIEPVFDLQGKSSATKESFIREKEIDPKTSLLDDYPMHIQESSYESGTGQNEDEQIVVSSNIVEQLQLSLEDEGAMSVMSYNSFQRIEKRAALKSKVEEHRQILNSKLSGLQTTSGNKDYADKDKEESLLDNESNHDDYVMHQKNHEIYNLHDEGVYLDLGNLMFNSDANVTDDDHSNNVVDDGAEHQEGLIVQPSSHHSSIISANKVFYILFIISVLFNVINRFEVDEEQEELSVEAVDINQQELVTSAINLLLFHFQLTKIHDEITDKLDVGKTGSNIIMFMIAIVPIMVVALIITSSMSWLKKDETKSIQGKNKKSNQAKSFKSPTPKKRLQREMSSLDKKNIFTSTVSAEVVMKDGSVAEVKKTMRFSPEVKRFSPSYYSKMKDAIKDEDDEKHRKIVVKNEGD